MKNSADLGECYPPRPSASVDNTLLDLQNSSYPTQPHSVIAKYSPRLRRIIVKYKHEWKFGRTRNAVGTRAAGECFHSFFEFSQILTSVCITR